MKALTPLMSMIGAAALALSAASALAADEPTPKEGAKAPTAQQQRMTQCNKDAKADGKTGDERKAFMKSCLSGKAPEQTAQQQKMTQCNKDAKAQNKAGDERKAFMKECLSAKS